MARISTYPLDNTVSLSDKLIGTDAEDSNATKNITIGSLVTLIGDQDLYVPYTGATENVNLGSYTITADEIIKVGGTSLQYLMADGSVSTGPVLPTFYYGSFYDTTDQTVTSGGIAAMKLGTTDISQGVSVVTDGSFLTRITMAHAGVYNIAFSAQMYRGSGGSTAKVSIWLRKNGNNVADSNTHLTMQANANYLVAAWNFFVDATAGDYYQIMWSQDDNISIQYDPADVVVPHPATPSVIVTVNKVS